MKNVIGKYKSIMGNSFTKLTIKIILLAGLTGVISCSGLGAPVTAKSQEQGKRVIHLTASSFEFNPNNITLPEPGTLSLIVDNISDIEHNFTIKNSEGQVLKSENLPAKKITTITLELPDPGRYEFYCDKPFHATFGMKGQIQVGS